MKTVFNNSDPAHTYSNQSQQSGRNSSGSFYFDGKTIYSYGHHFPIAKMVTNENGFESMLFTYRTYSNTTAKQISIVRNATRQYKKIYCHTPSANHSSNFSSWLQLAEHDATKLIKAKKPELYLSELSRLNSEVSKYAQFFNLAIPPTLLAVLSIKDKSENLDYLINKNALIKLELAKKQKEDKIKDDELLKKWINFETSRIYSRSNLDFLRVNINKNRVETTQAVQIPMEIAKRMYNKIKSNTLQVGETILNYKVNQVGDIIKIGCHNFTRKYLLGFGSELP
jgi:hypothetical protein